MLSLSSPKPHFTTLSFSISSIHPQTFTNHNFTPKRPMRTTAVSFLRSLSASLHHHRRRLNRRLLFSTLSVLRDHPSTLPVSFTPHHRRSPALQPPSATTSSLVEHEAYDSEQAKESPDEKWDFSKSGEESESFNFDGAFESTQLKWFENSAAVEVKELEELPEQWRRSKLAWLCKELPVHKPSTLIRVLNAQRKWVRQEDATYIAVHCMRIRENETAFRVYKWMIQQHWFQFDFALATKLTDYMGKERKFLKCREIFDDIINQGRVPSESTFHILIVAYLSSSAQGCLDEAFNIYSRMIQLGGYKPQLSLHNSVFRALVSRPAGSCKHYLKQAEFVFHNLETSGLEIHEFIYGGLIWLHSYQDVIDKERIASLRAEMQSKGIREGKEVLLSVLRACSKEGDIEETEKIWMKFLESDNNPPSQAFVYIMELYARIGQPMKSLDIFRDMQDRLRSTSVVAYYKIIEVLSKAQKTELAESLMDEFINSGLKPLVPSFLDLMDMYLNLSLHDKLEATFLQCLEKCRPNRTIYNMYLDSLVQIGNLDKAEEIFNQMHGDGALGVNTRSCNVILRGYLSQGEYVKAEKVYDLMCQKKYDIEPPLMEKLEYVLSLSRKVVKKPITLKLSKEQREILMGMLLGGLRIVSNEERRNHAICFEFNESSGIHMILKRHIHDQYHEWLASSIKKANGDDEIPYQFSSVSHSYFSFYADQFWPSSRPVIPKLIHRWLSPRVLAYWYMYGGYRTSSGDIVLKVKGSREGVERIVRTLKAKSLDCRIKRNGRVYWIGLLGNNATWFWKLVEPFIVDDLKDLLEAGGISRDGFLESQNINFDSGSETDEKSCDDTDDDSS